MLPSIPSLSAILPDAGSILNSALNSPFNQAMNQAVNPAGTTTFSPLNSSAASSATPFSSLLTDAVGQVNTLESQARGAVQGLMSGSGVDVHQAMIATEKSGMAFELALAVRNKALQAYQSVIGMQF